MIDDIAELYQPFRYKVLYGGRGSGKSQAFARSIVAMCNLCRLRVVCLREVQNSIKDSSYQLIVDIINLFGLSRKFEITREYIRHENGSLIIFRGLRNYDNIKSLEGYDIAWIEEAQSVSEESWRALIPTIRKESSEIWVSFNPKLKTDPTYKRFVLNPPSNAFVKKVNYWDNPYFPEPLRLEMEHDKETDYDAYMHIWEGFPVIHSEAQIFNGHFVVESFPDDLCKKAGRFFFGADFGFAKDPNTLVRCFMLDRKLYVDYEAYGIGVELDELPALYRSIPESEKWTIHADCARPETISYLRNRAVVDGVPTRFRMEAAKKWAGSIEDGISYLKSFEKIVIHPRCKHTADEFSLYSYKVDSRTSEVLPIIEDKNNHVIDAIRYSLDGYITQSGLESWSRLGSMD